MNIVRGMLSAAVGMSTAAFLSSTPAQATGALAVGHCSVDGYSYDHASVQEAADAALNQCGPGCRIVLTSNGACAALAVDHASNCGAEGWGSDRERKIAESMAITECVSRGGTACGIKRWVCDGG
jgi:basic membrane lipoprotein Med (substrate-binding protein (PBP1-ABC) superfamily)